MLLLDEPTNDLDLQTLRVLEDALLSFDGAMVVVTHDRAFLDRVCSRIVAFEGTQLVEYADRLQVLAAAKRRSAELEQQARAEKKREKGQTKQEKSVGKRLSFNEKRELDGFPLKIEQLETEKEALETILGDPKTYSDRAEDVSALNESLQALDQQIETAYSRWESLMARAEG